MERTLGREDMTHREVSSPSLPPKLVSDIRQRPTIPQVIQGSSWVPFLLVTSPWNLKNFCQRGP